MGVVQRAIHSVNVLVMAMLRGLYEKVCYDLNFDRDVPLTFLIRLQDGLEPHVLPEEVDDEQGKLGSRPHDTAVPIRLQGGYYQRSYEYLRQAVVVARCRHYQQLIFGDRFNGTQNSDYYRG